MKSTRSLSLVFSVVGLTAARLPAQTNVGGLICTDTTWDLAGSPYIVINSVIIGCDASLTIDPGVEVRFDPGLGITVGSIPFGPGGLIARGTNVSKILFTSNDVPVQPGDWSRIFFTDFARDAVFDVNGVYQSGSILEHAIVEYAGGGFPAVTVDQSSPFITNTEIRHNDHRGIDVNGASAPPIRIEQCEIWDNHVSGSGGGIRVTGGAGHRLTANNVHDCSATSLGGGIYVSRLTILEGNTIHDCSASSGGGAYFDNGSGNSILTSNMLTNNNASSSGGGLYFNFSSGCTLTDNTITANQASVDGGGVLFFHSGSCVLNNNTITGNLATDDGGGIDFQFSDSCVLDTDTITGNTALDLGGGLCLFGSDDCVLRSSTIVNNTANADGAILLNASDRFTMTGTVVTLNKTLVGTIGGILVGNSSTGVSLQGDPVTGVFNKIFDNAMCDVFNANSFAPANDIDARDVWWGTCDINQIQGEICDFFDDSARAIVLFLPIVEPGGDAEFDGDVDLDDFARFNPSDPTLPACFTGPCGPNCVPPLDPACGVFDFDCDGDVDERDFGVFANLFTGAFK